MWLSERNKALSYRDALRLLGSDSSRLVDTIGNLAGLGAGVVTVASVGTVDFFALRAEAVSWGNRALRRVKDDLSGISRFSRTEKLAAAHSVLVITAFFEAIGEILKAEPDFDQLLKLTGSEQVAMAVNIPVAPRRDDTLGSLLRDPLPLPTSYRPYELTRELILERYQALCTIFGEFLSGLTEFENDSARLRETLDQRDLPSVAIARYEEGYRSLAADVPEFALWASMVSEQATRTAIRASTTSLLTELNQVNVGMAGLERILEHLASGATPDQRRADLAKSYRGRLKQPILNPRDTPEGVAIPLLCDAYVNPRCRVAEVSRTDNPSVLHWWDDKEVMEDIETFLAGYLTAPAALTTPLVILGQPGSGKSVLTRILAARLPETDFMPIRVELRSVAADASIQDQIEEAIFQTIGERVRWPELSRGTGDALPVIFLDGFDEMLQAAGLNRADYLDRVQEFQLREAGFDRPVSVVVTSRTVVADRARFPDGTVAIELLPFDQDQISEWVSVWNNHNAELLASRGLLAIPVDTLMQHSELANQPLLLLLLALYDSIDNALQRSGENLGRVDLYEALFTRFAEREVEKHDSALDSIRLRGAVEREFRRLSSVALSMFNRGADVISDSDLEADVPQLLAPDDLRQPTTNTISRALSISQLLVGRFFFVHESQASLETGMVDRSYEFLHATFGEFLVARSIVKSLLDTADEERHQAHRPKPAPLDAGFLHAHLAFGLLAGRAPVRDFCRGLLSAMDAEQKEGVKFVLRKLLTDAAYSNPTWSMNDYEPRRITNARKYALFSANAVLLLTLSSDSALVVEDLLGGPAQVRWREYALLWESQLTAAEFDAIQRSLRVQWKVYADCQEDGCDAGLRRLTVGIEDDSAVLFSSLIPNTIHLGIEGGHPGLNSHKVWNISAGDREFKSRTDIPSIVRRAAFTQLADYSDAVYDALPALELHPRFWVRDGHSSLSQVRLFLEVLFRRKELDDETRLAIYSLLISHVSLSSEDVEPEQIPNLAYRQLVDDARTLPIQGVLSLIGELDEATTSAHGGFAEIKSILEERGVDPSLIVAAEEESKTN